MLLPAVAKQVGAEFRCVADAARGGYGHACDVLGVRGVRQLALPKIATWR